VPTAELQTTEFASIPTFMHSDVLTLLGKETNFGLSREKKSVTMLSSRSLENVQKHVCYARKHDKEASPGLS
jgi:hypothetical protein